MSTAKTAEPIEISDAVRVEDSGGPGNHVLDWGPDPPWKGEILGGKGIPL